mmetsp:Transcript_35764/g.106743  ORF Transcript_35764/g.106743 Transcript_35764/m.106743 type:complete len:289 (+) Transcript_35764:285-1151(+)
MALKPPDGNSLKPPRPPPLAFDPDRRRNDADDTGVVGMPFESTSTRWRGALWLLAENPLVAPPPLGGGGTPTGAPLALAGVGMPLASLKLPDLCPSAAAAKAAVATAPPFPSPRRASSCFFIASPGVPRDPDRVLGGGGGVAGTPRMLLRRSRFERRSAAEISLGLEGLAGSPSGDRAALALEGDLGGRRGGEVVVSVAILVAGLAAAAAAAAPMSSPTLLAPMSSMLTSARLMSTLNSSTRSRITRSWVASVLPVPGVSAVTAEALRGVLSETSLAFRSSSSSPLSS